MNLFELATRGVDLDALPDEPAPRERIAFEPSAPGKFSVPSDLNDAFQAAANDFGVDPDVLRAVAYAESRFRPDIISGNVKSKTGAIGLMQFMPATADEYGINPTDPIESIFGAAAYLRKSLDKFGGDYGKAVASYNAGPNRKAFDAEDWDKRLPAETRDYLMTVFGAADSLKQQAGTSTPATQATELPAGVTPSTAGGGRGSVSPGMVNTKLTRAAVPEMTAGSVAQDVGAGLLQVGPTAVKGVGELIRMATGDRLGKGVTDFADRGIKAAQDVVGSDRAAAQRQNFAADMADDGVSLGTTIANNKGALADQIIPMAGSMLLPVGVAGAAGKLATVGKAAQGLSTTALAARVASVQQAAGIGATAAQNAASTFAELVDKGVPMEDAYKAAGITVPFSLIAGKLTGGGAEGALIKGLSGQGVARGAAELGKGAIREGAQEGGESLGQVAGEVLGANQDVSLEAGVKRVGTEALLGAVMGGGMSAAQQLAPTVESQPTTPQVPPANSGVTPDAGSAANTQAAGAVDRIQAILEAGRNAEPAAPDAPASAAPVADFAQRTATPTPLAGAVPATKQADAEVLKLVEDVKRQRAQDQAETEKILQMLADDAARAAALVESSQEETAKGQAQTIAERSRTRLVDELVSGFAEKSDYFTSRLLPAVEKQLAVLGQPALTQTERAKVDALLGSARAFIAPKLPSAPAAKVEDGALPDTMADNSGLESLIKERKPKQSGLAAEMAALKARSAQPQAMQQAQPVQQQQAKAEPHAAPTPLLTDMEAALLGDFERLYQADVKGEIKTRLGMIPARTEEMQAPSQQKKSSALIQAIKEAGGIKSSIAADLMGDNAMRGNRIAPGLFKRNGMNLDMLVTVLKERGFLTQADEDIDSDNGGVNKVAELIQAELSGSRATLVDATAKQENDAAAFARAQLEDKAFALGLSMKLVGDWSNDKLNGVIGRIEKKLGRPVGSDFATRKMTRAEARAEREAILMADRVERVRVKYDAEIQAFAEANDRVQERVLDVMVDGDGNIEVIYERTAGEAYEDSRNGREDSGETGRPVAQGAGAGTGNPEADRAEAGAGSEGGQVNEPGSQYSVRQQFSLFGSEQSDQLQLFLDSGPIPSQAGSGAVAAQREAVGAVADLQSTASILAKALSRDYAARQRVSLVGQKVESAEDLAVLAQVYRDPRFETFRVLFTDDGGALVSQVGLTSRLPASAAVMLGNDIDAYLADLSNAAKQTGATGYYLLHNHPSGNAKPSGSDQTLTSEFARRMPGLKFQSHVVVDTNEYATISSNGAFKVIQKDFGQPTPQAWGAFANRQITSPDDVMSLAKEVQSDSGAVTLIATDTQYRVKAITTIPLSAVSGVSKGALRLRVARVLMSFRSSNVFAVGRSKDSLKAFDGIVVDAVQVDAAGGAQSLAASGLIDSRNLGAFPRDRRARVSPDTSGAFAYLMFDPSTLKSAGQRLAAGESIADYTPAEVTARQDAAAQAEAAARSAEAAADKAEAAAKQASEIAQRSVAAADTFELGGNAEDNLSGQQGLKFSKKAESLDDITRSLDDAGVSNTISERDGVITVSKILVPKDQRNSGIGTDAMQRIVSYADRTGQHIALTPSADFGGNKSRLTEFYKRFGFKENKGRNRVFSVSESMVRENPKGKTLFSFAGSRAESADRMALMTAQDRIDAGDDAETVRQETGWFKGVDGRWRFEISDNEAKVDTTLLSNLARGGFDARPIEFITYRQEAGGTYSLSLSPVNPTRTSDFVSLSGVPESLLPSLLPIQAQEAIQRGDGEADIIGPNLDDAKRVRAPFQFEGFNALPLEVVMDHPKLFAAYPALREIMVRVDTSLGNGATFAEMDYVDGTKGKEIRIGSPKAANVDNVLLHEIQHCIQSIEGFATGGSVKPFQAKKQAASATYDLMRQTFEQWDAEYRARNGDGDRNAAFQYYGDKIIQQRRDDARRAMKTAQRDLNDVGDPMDSYRRLAGEVEARNTQARQRMTDAERRNTAPSATADVADGDVIVVMNGKEMASAPMPENAHGMKPTAPRTPISTITQAITKAYGNALNRLQGKGLVTLTQSEDDALKAAAAARAAKSGTSEAVELASLQGSVSASMSPMKSIDANVRRGLKSLAKALDEKTSVNRAMFRNGLGWVDFVWGDVGVVKPNGRTKGAMGISHILEARQRKDGMSDAEAVALLESVVEAIASGTEFNRAELDSATRVGVEKDGTIVWLTKQKGSNAWVVTAYEKNPDGANAGRATSAPTSPAASRTRDQRVAGFADIMGLKDVDVKRSADGHLQGFFDPATGKSFLVADNLTAETAPAVFMHEVGIHMAADGKMQPLFDRAANLLKMARGNAFIQRVQDRMDSAGETSGEEAAAYIVEEYERDRTNAPSSVVKWVKDFIADVRAWLFGKGVLLTDDQLTVADIAAVARANVRGMAESVVEDQTQTEAFKRWYSGQDAKAAGTNDVGGTDGQPASAAVGRERSGPVDAQGRPVVFFHGTRDDISQFDVGHPNRKDTGWLGRGIYGTSDPDIASRYAGAKRGDGNQNVMPLYFAVVNPYLATLDVKRKLSKAPQAYIDQFTEKVKALGHDGVMLEHPDGSTEIVAFEPTQVKSATGNNGDFDGTNPDIRRSVAGPAQQPQRSAWRDDQNRVQFAPGAWLFDRLGKVADPVLSWAGMKAATPELKKQLRTMKLGVQKAQETSAMIATETAKLTQEEREMVSDLIEKTLKAGVVPPAHAVKLAALINQTMSAQTDELIELGMLSAETAERWRGEYLPRFYASKLRKGKDSWVDAMKSITQRVRLMQGVKGKHLKARGLFETVDAGQIADYEALGWELRDDGYTPGKSRTAQMWRDFTPEERENMGEIRDAGFRFVMGYMQTQKDIALGRMYKSIAETDTLSSRLPTGPFTVRVPETKVEGTGAKVYGALAGRYVSKDVLDHLSGFGEAHNDILQTYRKAMSLWKEGKTVLNPVSHVNNTVSNLTMAHLAGVGYHRVDKYAAAARDFATNSPLIEKAKDAGLFLGSFNQAELFDAMPPELKELAKMEEGKGTKVVNGLMQALSFGLRNQMGKAYEFEDAFFKYVIFRDSVSRGMSPEDAVDYAQRFIFTYDDLPKTARRIRDFGIPFFAYTYKAVPALLESALKHPERMALPATVIWAATTLAYAVAAGGDDEPLDELVKRYATDQSFRDKVGEAKKFDQEHLPKWMRGYTSLAVPKVIRVGTDAALDMPVFMDISRLIPGGDLFDVTPNGGGIPWFQSLTPNHPLLTLFTGLFVNKDMFLGKELVDKNDTSAEAAEKRSMWVYRQLAPAVAVGSYHWDRGMELLANLSDGEIKWLPEVVAERYTGTDRSGLPVQPKYAIPQTFGIKLRPIDQDKAEQIEAAMDNKLLREIDAEMRQIRRLNQAGALSDKRADKMLDLQQVKKDRLREGLTVDGDPKD